MFVGNWDSIKNEISSSNVLQRDSVMFAKKLGSNMEQFARERDEEVSLELLVVSFIQIKVMIIKFEYGLISQ